MELTGIDHIIPYLLTKGLPLTGAPRATKLSHHFFPKGMPEIFVHTRSWLVVSNMNFTFHFIYGIIINMLLRMAIEIVDLPIYSYVVDFYFIVPFHIWDVILPN